MAELSETQVVLQLEAWRKEGSASRDSGKPCPYPGNTLAHYMHSDGWLRRDLQLGLCRANPAYHRSQMSDPFIAAIVPTPAPFSGPWSSEAEKQSEGARVVKEALLSLTDDATAFRTLAHEASDAALCKLWRLLK